MHQSANGLNTLAAYTYSNVIVKLLAYTDLPQLCGWFMASNPRHRFSTIVFVSQLELLNLSMKHAGPLEFWRLHHLERILQIKHGNLYKCTTVPQIY